MSKDVKPVAASPAELASKVALEKQVGAIKNAEDFAAKVDFIAEKGTKELEAKQQEAAKEADGVITEDAQLQEKDNPTDSFDAEIEAILGPLGLTEEPAEPADEIARLREELAAKDEKITKQYEWQRDYMSKTDSQMATLNKQVQSVISRSSDSMGIDDVQSVPGSNKTEYPPEVMERLAKVDKLEAEMNVEKGKKLLGDLMTDARNTSRLFDIEMFQGALGIMVTTNPEAVFNPNSRKELFKKALDGTDDSIRKILDQGAETLPLLPKTQKKLYEMFGKKPEAKTKPPVTAVPVNPGINHSATPSSRTASEPMTGARFYDRITDALKKVEGG